MKHVSLAFGILFSFCCLFCQAQLMPLNVESVTLNTEDGVIKGVAYCRIRADGYGW